IEWSADCNNNGVVDFGEIRNGFAVDTNGNNIPDECECASDPTLAICCPEDIIEDGAVNAIDLAAILNTWGTVGGEFPRADVDGSGTVDGADLAAVLSQWGPCE
ncbi:MAG: dockerin type I domain-containing protein, partial [bacterium]